MDEVKRIRRERGLSQRRLAELAGVNKVTLVHTETGKSSPNVETLEKLADALEVEVADFFPKVAPPLPFDQGAEERWDQGRRVPTSEELEEATTELERLIAQRKANIERWRRAGIDALEEAACGAYDMDRANEQIYRDLQAWNADEVIKGQTTLPAEDVDAAYRRVNAFGRLLSIAAEARNVVWELSKQTSREAAKGLALLEEIRLEEREA